MVTRIHISFSLKDCRHFFSFLRKMHLNFHQDFPFLKKLYFFCQFWGIKWNKMQKIFLWKSLSLSTEQTNHKVNIIPSKLNKCTSVQFQRADEDALCCSSNGSFLMDNDVLVVHVVESGLFSWKCSKTLVCCVSVDLSTVVGIRKSWLSTIFCWEIRHPLLMCQRNSCFKVYIWERNLSANLASCSFSERSWLACWSNTAMRSNLRMRHLEAATRLRARLRSTCKYG